MEIENNSQKRLARQSGIQDVFDSHRNHSLARCMRKISLSSKCAGGAAGIIISDDEFHLHWSVHPVIIPFLCRRGDFLFFVLLSGGLSQRGIIIIFYTLGGTKVCFGKSEEVVYVRGANTIIRKLSSG